MALREVWRSNSIGSIPVKWLTLNSTMDSMIVESDCCSDSNVGFKVLASSPQVPIEEHPSSRFPSREFQAEQKYIRMLQYMARNLPAHYKCLLDEFLPI